MSGELNIDLAATGLTVTANVYSLGVAKATGIACAEIGVTGNYSGDFTATPNVAGVYQVAFFVGVETLSRGGGQIVWDGSAEVVQTGDAFARVGAAGAGLTALGDARIANLDAPVSSRSTYAGGAVASVTGNVGGNVAGSVGSVSGLTSADVGAIKAKTDNLPLAPAATGDIPTAASIADAVWDEAISEHAEAGSTGAILSAAAAHSTGVGAIAWPYTVTDSASGVPIGDVDVWVTTDSAGENVVATGRTNASGIVTFYLDSGVAYFWSQKTGINFSNPDTETIA